ncbi:MAG TPA: DNA primase [Steroidobacteraceae bacterium]
MSGRIPRHFIDELIARADIVEIIGSRVALKKAGREYKACCPFHDEKTPSFWVSPDKQFYHCFGCGAHGTALGFLMQYDQLPFPEAVEDLATRLGLTVPHEGAGAAGAAAGGAPADELAPLYALLGRVAEFYAANLQASARALRYAGARGLESATIQRFQIGYAPDAWDEVLRRFGERAEQRQGLIATGLIIERTSGTEGYYDRFRDRLMFPIRDTRGRVIAFGGRVLEQGEPKYLNSPETALFHKGKELYGLYESRLARQSLKRLLVVEGYMDTVRLHQASLTYAVATLGTATTPEHLRRAFRLVSELVFCFDGDRAGRSAAWRALHNVLPEAREGREIRFLFLPDGQDPDSLVGSEGGEAFEARLRSALPLSEYLVAHLGEEAELSHADGKARFVALARPLIDKLTPGVYRELVLDRIAQALGCSAARLQQWLARPEGGTGSAAAREAAPAAVRASAHASSALPAYAAAPARGLAAARAGRGSLITQAIALLLHHPAAASAVSAGQRQALARLTHPGVSVLSELLEELLARPALSMAQTLERWRDRSEYRRLCELASAKPLVADGAAAGRELTEAIGRLLDAQLRGGRLEALIEKARAQDLDEAEKQELQALTTGHNKAGPG